ncbi:MAG: GAF and ANTAR domain-containing protein [Acidimicrobiia bacterium]
MADYDSLFRALRSFAAHMGTSYDMTEMSYELCDRAAEVLEVTGAGVSIADRNDQLRFLTATGNDVVELEHVQEKTQQGPCYSAYQTQETVVVPDMTNRAEWPDYMRQAEKLGLRAVVGYPLRHNGTRLGALNIYHFAPREWSETEIEAIAVLADMATAYLVRTSELSAARRLADQLQEALDNRVVIEQAKGMVAGQSAIGLDAAFEALRNHARNNNLRLKDVCAKVVGDELRIPGSAG